jgi:thiol-disulfide isomerase/thioredoxin
MKQTTLIPAIAIAIASAAWGQSIDGLWDGTVVTDGFTVPFKVGFSGSGASVKGWFFNGEEKEESTSGKLDNGSLVLNFDSYASVLNATVKDGAIDGTYKSNRGGAALPFHAVPAKNTPAPAVKAPDIAGLWYLQSVKSRKHDEKAWQFFVTQKGAEVTGAILRVDGDTGALSGTYKDGKFTLSHFSGARAALVEVTPNADGTLKVDLKGQHDSGALTAVRPEVARAKGLDLPADYDKHTGVTDPTKPFAFRFPDLNGKIVSSDDAQFKGKVVLINVTGSWCPNCHDEDEFLPKIYNKYHAKGLEIVALDFEEPEQLANPVRLKTLLNRYGAKYTVLLGGETSSAKDKLPQASGWDSWPTTFFVGRDGLVKSVHAGFPSPGAGDLYKKEVAAFTAEVERLLAESPTTTR